jgi:hypothetical protein
MGTQDNLPPVPHGELNLSHNLISEKATILSYLKLLQVNTFVTLNVLFNLESERPPRGDLSEIVAAKSKLHELEHSSARRRP